MYRWHKEMALLEKRLKMDVDKHYRDFIAGGGQIRDRRFHKDRKTGEWVVFDGSCGCELGMFRKVHPLRCPDSRLRGRGGCKAHKILGNGRGAKKFSHIRRLESTEDYDGEHQGIA